jgi:hypothetical protein
VNVCRQVSQATAGRFLLLTSATWKSLQQPGTSMARPVLFSTTTRPGMDDPAVIVGDGRTTRADIDAGDRWGAVGKFTVGEGPWGRPERMWPPLAHPATTSASTMTSDLTPI